MRAEARGPSGMLMASMPNSWSRRAFWTWVAGDTPLGETISTKVTNCPAASFAPSRDFSALGTTEGAVGVVILSVDSARSMRREGRSACTARRMALICVGFVPQQPPTMEAPVRMNRLAYSAIYSGDVI